MGNAVKDLSTALKGAISRAAAYTVGIEREPYAVSGVLVGGDRVLTAAHLVDGEVVVHLPNGTTAKARVAAEDPTHDLALLRLEGKHDAPVPPTAKAEVGDLVLTLKRDPFDGINASLAVVSASGASLKLGRASVLERYLQTDADRLPGMTGGPLVDGEGALAGILVFNRRMGAEVALPVDLAMARAKLLEEKGSVQRPYLGLRSQAVELSKQARDALKTGQATGLLLVTVEDGGAAAAAGLEVGDILVTFAGRGTPDHGALVSALAERGAGAKVEVEVLRGGTLRTLPITVGGR